MLGVDGHGVHQSMGGWVPVYADGAAARLACMSVGFLLKNKGDSVVWRGPKKNGMIRQFLSDVRWGDLDYLVIDTPPDDPICFISLSSPSISLPSHPHLDTLAPFLRVLSGTSDEHLSLIEHLAPVRDKLSSVIVTTPQVVALTDSMKCLSFTRNVGLPVLGLIENMSGYVCPCCGEVSNVFSTGGGEDMAKREGLRLLGSLPVDTELVTLLDAAAVAECENEQREQEPEGMEGASAETQPPGAAFELLAKYEKTPTAKLFKDIASRAIETLNEGEDHLPR
ncbi:MRP-like protein [Schizophyllum commune]